jgi:hypothetical protein
VAVATDDEEKAADFATLRVGRRLIADDDHPPHEAAPHFDGDPLHDPPQQSPAELQSAPSARQGAVQTGTPLGPGAH